MKIVLASFALTAVLALPSWWVRVAHAGAPTDQVRERIEQVYHGFTAAPPEGRHAVARTILDQMFDWTEMARRSLGRHWQDRTAVERAEFTRLFADLFERAYVSKIQLADADRFQYLGDAVEGNRAIVRTKIVTRNGNQIPVDYLTRLDDRRRWRVDDLNIEGISLVENYRAQFNAVVIRSSYQGLVERLKVAAK